MIDSESSSPDKLKKDTCTPVTLLVAFSGNGTSIKMDILYVLSSVLEVKEHIT